MTGECLSLESDYAPSGVVDCDAALARVKNENQYYSQLDCACSQMFRGGGRGVEYQQEEMLFAFT